MNPSRLAYLFPAGLLALATACGPSAGAAGKQPESTTRTTEGTVATTSESTPAGTSLVSRTGTKVEAPAGNPDVKIKAVVGTVTVYTAGRKVEVTTAEKKTLAFDLDEKGVVYSVDPAVAVGRKVTVVDETGRDSVRRVWVKLGS